MINFEAIFAALFSLVSTSSSSFVTVSRRSLPWSQVPQRSQPALFQEQHDFLVKQKAVGLPATYTLDADIIIYAYSTDKTIAPSTVLNPLIGAVVNALAPDVNGKQTLGLPNVSHCWIEGTIATDEGTLGDQAVAIIPIKILAT
jgi:hypothetical protein